MDFWKTRKFKDLNQEWNQKLKESGFEDHETEKGDRSLKQRSTNCYRQASAVERESRLEYYLFLGYLTYNTQFPNDLEQTIMVRHSEGWTIKEIVEEITIKGISRDRKTVRRIIRRWQMKWGIRSWSLKQMHLKSIK